MAEKKFSKGEAISFGWKTMQDNLGFFIGLMLILFAVAIVPAVISEATKKSMPLFSFVISVASYLINLLLAMGIIKIVLRFCDHEKGRFEDLFAFPHLFLRYFGANLLMSLVYVGFGIMGFLLGLAFSMFSQNQTTSAVIFIFAIVFIALMIPAIIIALRLGFFGYLIVDRNFGAIESLKKSFEMTKGATLDLIIFSGLLLLMNLAGFLCLLIGLFATIPTSIVAMAYVYRKLLQSDEPAPTLVSQ